jgi:hypothetical protein
LLALDLILYHFFAHDGTKAAPSLICEELPAVTLPPASKTGRNPAKASLEFQLLVLHLCLQHKI